MYDTDSFPAPPFDDTDITLEERMTFALQWPGIDADLRTDVVASANQGEDMSGLLGKLRADPAVAHLI